MHSRSVSHRHPITSPQYQICSLMVHSDFIAVHCLTSAGASLSQLSQQLCVLHIFACAMPVAMQRARVGRCQPMRNDGGLDALLQFR